VLLGTTKQSKTTKSWARRGCLVH